jgi:hypothetical protein
MTWHTAEMYKKEAAEIFGQEDGRQSDSHVLSFCWATSAPHLPKRRTFHLQLYNGQLVLDAQLLATSALHSVLQQVTNKDPKHTTTGIVTAITDWLMIKCYYT